jgi:betaine-aldehyde dehydrogenase
MATVLKRQELFIGGKWVAGGGEEVESIRNPATGKVIAMVPRGTAEDVERAVAAARKAYEETWIDTTPGERSKMLLDLADAVEENGEELARIESENVGKPLASTVSEEIPFIVDNLRFFAGGARLLEGKAAGEYMRGFTSFIRREPVGVVASIAPWN